MSGKFGIDADPLALGTLYEPIGVNPDQENENGEVMYAASGTVIEEFVASEKYTIEMEYYLHEGATALSIGDTHNGWEVASVKGPKKGNRAYETMTVTVQRRAGVAKRMNATGTALLT